MFVMEFFSGNWSTNSNNRIDQIRCNNGNKRESSNTFTTTDVIKVVERGIRISSIGIGIIKGSSNEWCTSVVN